MATLHLIHGICGSGKTTFAKQLEREIRAVRFTPDEWMVKLHGTNPPAEKFQEALERVFELIWEHTARVLRTGTDVILDFGFWSRASRNDARRRATALGASYRLYVVACPEDVARRRVLERTTQSAEEALHINEWAFDVFLTRVEPLAADEPHAVVKNPFPPAT
jgi:predicted kinase